MKYFVSIALILFSENVIAQKHRTIDSANATHTVDSINRLLDLAVTQKNAGLLQKNYADDFVFTHGTGQVDSKQSWISFVTSEKANYQSRMHDSVTIEIHDRAAIVKGKLTVKNIVNGQPNAYAIKYYRFYTLKNKTWQLLSHHTYKEIKLPEDNK